MSDEGGELNLDELDGDNGTEGDPLDPRAAELLVPKSDGLEFGDLE